MLNLLNIFRKDKIWDFDGGIHPPEMKTQSNGTPLRQLPLADRFIIPLKQHIGHEGEICVKPGDKVLRGQPLTFGTGRMLPVHAPTSGVIEAIGPHMTAHPSGLAEMSVFIAPDGEDRWIERDGVADYRQLPREEVIKRIHQAGVAGLGGAGFPTATKLKGGLNSTRTLIINAAECEPYITADDRLMQDCADEVIEGSRILAWVLQAERVLIGIEDNKPEAIAALKRALGGANDLQLRVIPTKYPSGGAKQLTKILTGKEVPHGGRSSDIGVLMQNVGTAWAVKRAIIDGEPLTERVVTLTGEAVTQPGNVWGRLGTPVSHLLHHAGFQPQPKQMVIMGGPLMGFTLPALDVPVVKITNCLLAPSASEMGEPQPELSCIRCSACADACPANLLPQQLYWYSQGADHDKARAYHIDDCIECGACAWVCPSNIPLVQYYRQEKAELRAIDLEAKRTAEAKARFEARQARLEREKLAREARHAQAKRKVSASEQDEIAAALARVKAKKAAEVDVNAGDAPDNAAVIAQREARKALARQRQAEKQAETEPLSRQACDPRKAAVEAAIARAKAKKAQQEQDNAEIQSGAADPRKAAVEAAIARAKAKKAQQAQDAAASDSAPDAVDPRKAAVEAAIARAKAKKAQQAQDAAASDSAPDAVDPRKAAVEAAIARAKAKKAQQAQDAAASESAPDAAEAIMPESERMAEAADARKVAVATAIARAKAKKAQQATAEKHHAAEETETESQSVPSTDAMTPESESVPLAAAEPESADAAPVDARKAAIEAAVARAKAKKAQQQAAENADTDEADARRKAAVAAAVARAKARKAQQQTGLED
ncbi:electron transport complex subunit RsxC [Mixta calida]|uniref:Ion-translocating oxidoreductase complex subunit C n=1 Tax=Mixta calida TaxID=665913 RepID=A0ABM6S109_9GAMM|nr:electron transport complex subunit RsxC [Mixta calida]AUY25218.1 electron transport complex subunit RsxC [Mixta calida]